MQLFGMEKLRKSESTWGGDACQKLAKSFSEASSNHHRHFKDLAGGGSAPIHPGQPLQRGGGLGEFTFGVVNLGHKKYPTAPDCTKQTQLDIAVAVGTKFNHFRGGRSAHFERCRSGRTDKKMFCCAAASYKKNSRRLRHRETYFWSY